MKHGKKYTDSRKLVDSTKLYEPAEALDLCAKTGKAKFDETSGVDCIAVRCCDKKPCADRTD